MANLVANLTLLMDRSGLDTQEKVAKAAGVSQTHVGNILRRDKLPGVRVLERIAAGFGIEVWQLLAPNVILSAGISKDFSKVFEAYARASDSGRSTILQVAEAQALYSTTRPAVDR